MKSLSDHLADSLQTELDEIHEQNLRLTQVVEEQN